MADITAEGFAVGVVRGAEQTAIHITNGCIETRIKMSDINIWRRHGVIVLLKGIIQGISPSH